VALFYIFLFYVWPFLHVRNLEENLLCFTLILGSVFSDCVVFYGDSYIALSTWYPDQRVLQSRRWRLIGKS